MGEESLIKKASKRYKYDEDNVRFSVKYFVEDFNAFFKKYNRTPKDHDEKEHRLYLRWYIYRNSKNLNDAEIDYIDKNMVDIGKISWLLQKFVDDFKVFYAKYNRLPLQKAETKEERSVYSRYRYYTNQYVCNEEELKLLQEIGLIPTDNVRKVVKNFVKEFNEFYKKKGRKPSNAYEEEKSLYYAFSRYSNYKNLNEEEIEYIKKNLCVISDIRESVKKFVKDYKKFCKEYSRVPNSKSSDDKERRLFRKYYFYSNALNLNNDEINYIIKNGIKIRGLDKLEKYNRKFEIKGDTNEI